MTGTRDPQQDGSIQAMLRDSGLAASTELRDSLEQLRALVPGRAPAPRADLAALLAAGAHGSPAAGSPTAGSPAAGSPTAVTTAMPAVVSPLAPADGTLPAGVTSLADRRGRKRRLAIVGGAVAGAMALGAGAVAASSEDFRHNVGQTIGVLFQPAGHVPAPAPEHAQPSPSPSSIPAVPAVPAPTAAAAAVVPGSAAPAAPATRAPGRATPMPSAPPPAVGRGTVLPAPGQGPVNRAVPRLPGLPGLGQGNGKQPLPAPVTPTIPGGITPAVPGQP
ncbi:hypothetical protein [Pseudarthrobacter albicanus]|uniref:hypothetical protein n=1 Tax=Pseudarthrobacter albicanus TaxID=2823873 RepID=UPI001BACC29A|nr:hypothetical protein [Pseudarthrobacter albicanus]